MSSSSRPHVDPYREVEEMLRALGLSEMLEKCKSSMIKVRRSNLIFKLMATLTQCIKYHIAGNFSRYKILV